MELLVSQAVLRKKGRFAKWMGDQEIVAMTTPKGIHVFSGLCPHQGGPMVQGDLKGALLTCPWHGCTFDLDNGSCVDIGTCKNLSGMKLQMIPFEIKGGDIYVHTKKSS
jgi:nitrite reductase (NADH) small subunit